MDIENGGCTLNKDLVTWMPQLISFDRYCQIHIIIVICSWMFVTLFCDLAWNFHYKMLRVGVSIKRFSLTELLRSCHVGLTFCRALRFDMA